MNKSEFMNELEHCLSKLDKEETSKFLLYYDEMIEDYMENGYSEMEAVNKIGNPRNIANDILDNLNTSRKTEDTSESRRFNRALVILGFPLWGSLLFAGLMSVLSAYIIVWCIPFTTGVSAIALLIGGIISIICSPFAIADTLAMGMMQLGIGIALIGVSILLALLTVNLIKKETELTKRINRKVIEPFSRRVVKA